VRHAGMVINSLLFHSVDATCAIRENLAHPIRGQANRRAFEPSKPERLPCLRVRRCVRDSHRVEHGRHVSTACRFGKQHEQ
jgi:hypothetical protein